MLNKATIIGYVTKDPEIRNTNSGKSVSTFSIATNEYYKKDGERKQITEYHNIVIFSDFLVSFSKDYIKKGSKLYVEGKIKTRKYESGSTYKYITQIVLSGYESKLLLLNDKNTDKDINVIEEDKFDDDIPF